MSRKGASVVAVSSSTHKLVSGFFFDGVTTGAETRGRLCIFPSFAAVGIRRGENALTGRRRWGE